MSEVLEAMHDICQAWPALQPPNRIRVSEGAAANLVIKRPGGAGGHWNPLETPYMVEPVDMLGSRRHSAVCFVGPAQTGKCVDVEALVPTPAGWTTMGRIKPGQEVFGPDGFPTKVLGASPVKAGLPCYRVCLDDGSALIVDSEHLWGVERRYSHAPLWRYEVCTTEQMARDLLTPQGHARYRIRNALPLQYPERGQLPLSAYVLGLWIGDGSSDRACLSAHETDVAEWIKEISFEGHEAKAARHHGKAFRLTLDAGVKGAHAAAGSFTAGLKALNLLGNKHLPAAYLQASEKDRWSLLQGLMDTDGSALGACSVASFTCKTRELRDSFVALCRSLGLTPRVLALRTTWKSKGERRFGSAHRVQFSVPAGAQVFRLRRKQEVLSAPVRDARTRGIVGVESVKSRPVRCIRVAHESGLFVCGEDFVVTHNTVGLGEGWLTHNVINDPGDMLVIQMTQDKAREYSKQRIDRAIKNSPNLRAMRSAQARDDNLHDKQFKNGMWVRIAWPTATNLSSTSYRYVFGTDYDRWPDDIDGEGDGFTLMGKRVTTFLSRGMVAVESSPGRHVRDPSWRPATPHEAPPVGGILGIYNRSDRRRWYWKCPHCAERFEAAPGTALFRLPDDDQLIEDIRDIDIDRFALQHARVPCPHCGAFILPSQREAMNRSGLWVPDGVVLDAQDRPSGTPRTSSIAGYWLGGAAATYVTWEMLVRKHCQALLDYALTGSELTLQTTANTDQGVPHLSRLLAEAAKGRGATQYDADLVQFVVPDWTRFVVASVDVQGGSNARFEVQVHAIGEHMEQALVTRYPIKESAREGMGGQKAPLDPAAYPEDWDQLDPVLTATYRTRRPGLEIRTYRTIVDTGGEDGVTNNAYAWYRRKRKQGVHARIRLSKGASGKPDWFIRETEVGGKQGHGDVPLQLLNADRFKDMVAAGRARRTPGPGYYHWPRPKHPVLNPDGWLPQAFFDELDAEIRNEAGVWEQVKKRNEALDLCAMIRALCMMLKADERRFWDSPPGWALPLFDGNTETITQEVRRVERETSEAKVRPPFERSVRRSAYLG